MPALSTWNLDPTRILTRRELTTVLADLSARASRANTQRNLIIVRLACCCGLRVSEIAGLQLDDVVADVQRPYAPRHSNDTNSPFVYTSLVTSAAFGLQS